MNYRGFFAFLLIIAPSTLLAFEELSDPPETNPQQESQDENITSPEKDVSSKKNLSGRQAVHESALQLANWIDNYFGEDEGLETASYDYLRLVNRVSWREGESINYSPRVQAKFHLPKINKKLSLFLSDTNDLSNEQFANNQSNNLLFDKNDDHQATAALNYDSDTYRGSKFSHRIGLNSSLQLFALTKHTLPLYEDEKLRITNRNYLFWKDEEGLGVNPKIELDRVMDENTLFRWKYSILRSEKSEGNEWNNRFSLVKNLTSTSWVSYDMDINGATEQQHDVETYRLALRYRWQMDIKWLYFEIEPELLWQRELESIERNFIPGLILRLEVQFTD